MKRYTITLRFSLSKNTALTMATHSTDSRAFHQHNNGHCINEALRTAQQICHYKGVKLAPVREQIFTLVWQSNKPLGAYSILERLAQRRGKEARPAPLTVYRALDCLQEHSLVHRTESLNAYIGCCTAIQPHQNHFLICRLCNTTVKVTPDDISQGIDHDRNSY